MYFDSDIANPDNSVGRTSGKGFVFRTDANTSETPNGKELLVINQNGNVGIGDPTDKSVLSINVDHSLPHLSWLATATNQAIFAEGRCHFSGDLNSSAVTITQRRSTSNANDWNQQKLALEIMTHYDGDQPNEGLGPNDWSGIGFGGVWSRDNGASSGFNSAKIAVVHPKMDYSTEGSTHSIESDMVFITRTPNNNLEEHMRITSEGNVGIGGDPSIARLKVINDGGGNNNRSLVYVQTFDANSVNTWQSLLNVSSYENSIGEVSLNQRGVSIGTHANSNGCGTIHMSTTNGANNYYMWVDNNGQYRTSSNNANIGNLTSTVVGDQSSDERLKVIEDNFEYGLDSVMKLKPIAFKMKDDENETRKLGFGAQTTQSIVPEAVYDSGDCIDGYDIDGETETPRSEDTKLVMQYVQLIPVLTKAIQELKAEVNALKKKNK